MPVFETSQFVPANKSTCWEFFSDPSNLSLITPPAMNFRIRYPVLILPMYEGMIIRYTVSPLLKIPLEWITEITHVRRFEYFVDNQIKGPFSLWHHQHIFREVSGGVEMVDIVNYELPFGKIGEISALWLVRKRIQEIFDYRRLFVESRFNGL